MSDKTFVFSSTIDGQYVIDLYADDYVMIEETFSDVLLEYDDFVEKINTCFLEKDVPALKSAIHKVKPLFGFVGLTDLQTLCLRFENACEGAELSQLVPDYTPLFERLLQAKLIIQNEHDRLTAFNRE